MIRPPRTPENVLVVRLSALGDVVNCLPALSALVELWPEATFDAVSEELGCSVLAGHPQLDRLIRVPRKGWQKALRSSRKFGEVSREFESFTRELRSRHYDVVVDFQGNLRSRIVSMLTRANLRVTHHPDEVREHAALFLRTPRIPSGHVSRVEKHLHLVRALGWSGVPPAAMLPIDPDARLDCAPILLHPFVSRRGRFKEWPREHFSALARQLSDCGSEVWVTWGPGEEDDAQGIVDASGGHARLAPATPTPESFKGLLASARVLVAADTGPLHLAAMANVPVVGLYGPKDPVIYAPWARHRRVLRTALPCSPCTQRDCSHSLCMALLSPREVAEAIRDLLQETADSFRAQ